MAGLLNWQGNNGGATYFEGIDARTFELVPGWVPWQPSDQQFTQSLTADQIAQVPLLVEKERLDCPMTYAERLILRDWRAIRAYRDPNFTRQRPPGAQ